MTRGAHTPAAVPAEPRVRIDKWLWAARFYKTRSLAAEAIDTGHVRVDGERVKPAQTVRCGARVSIRKREATFDVDVQALSEQRGPATQAAKLYRETAESVAARERLRTERAQAHANAAAARPTKRDRRRLEDFLNEP
ncbi:MAG TPA: RNA-binding S4 domain-containing protein [Casimicrobiaceae bacterium]|jgi:ribosome-associated heat shock protein Hsp15|nr:RNA-binding S4 domain-containing protein [Casimicrobiaceae bacterium]